MGDQPPGRGRPFLRGRLAAEPEFRRRVELADRLGIPPSRLDGREPVEVTEHAYDGDRLVRSITRREPAYTEADRAELLALALYRDGLCPACGGPLDECTTQESMDTYYRASRVRCLRRDALAMSQNALGDVDRPEALVWSVSKIRR